jgi:FkbM family methyltransferase
MGQYAIARTLIGRWSVVPPALVTQRMVGGAVFELDLSDRIQAEAFLVRRYAADVIDVLANRLAPGQVFFDIGANVGLVTFSVGVRVPRISVHAFEPHPAKVARWRRNRSLNSGVRAIVEAVALGERKRSTRLHVTDQSGSRYVSDLPEEDGITVPMMTLDEYSEARGIETVHALNWTWKAMSPWFSMARNGSSVKAGSDASSVSSTTLTCSGTGVRGRHHRDAPRIWLHRAAGPAIRSAGALARSTPAQTSRLRGLRVRR